MHGTTSDLSCAEEVSALILYNLVPHAPNKGAKRLDQFGDHRDAEGGVGEASSTEFPHEEGPREESMCEDKPEDAGDKDGDDEDTDEESMSSSGSSQESPHSTCRYSDRCCHPPSWAEHCESEDRKDGSLGRFSTGQYSRSKGESEVGHLPALTSSPPDGQESSSKLMEAAQEETASTVSNILPTGNQNAVVIHTTKDELKSLD